MHWGYILLNCDLGAEERVIEELKHISGIKNARLTAGVYDAIAEIHVDGQKEFEEVVAGRVRNLNRVGSAMTLGVTDSA